MTGSELLIETLRDLGIRHIFGYPGGAVLSILDTLYRERDIDFILTRHEQGAVHAADAYGRITGTPGVCMATSGPGATNLVTGIMTAHMDSSPLIAITGQVPSSERGLDNFQEVDIIGITLPITKHSYSVERASDIPRILREAYRIATTGRPGPVVIDIPADIQGEEVGDSLSTVLLEETHISRILQDVPEIEAGDLDRVSELLSTARRPLLLAGAGILRGRASGDLIRFAERNNIPVVTSLLGIGSIPSDHPLSLGMGGIHGTIKSREALEDADVVIALGLRIENRFSGGRRDFLSGARVVHVDIDESELGKNIDAHIQIHGDTGEFLRGMPPRRVTTHSDIWVRDMTIMDSFIRRGGEANPENFISRLNPFIDRDTILCTDVGQHQMWVAQHCRFIQGGQHITSGGAGTMGFALPASIGIQLAQPEKKVYCIVGDGGIQMTLQELICLKERKLPVTVIIMNNSCLGMVKQLQDNHKEGRHMGVHLSENPDFMALAAAYGIEGRRARTPREFDHILKENPPVSGPRIIECIVGIEENVYCNF